MRHVVAFTGLVSLWVLGASPAFAAEPGSGPGLTIKVDPAYVQLWAAGAARVEVEASGLSEVRLTTNVGRIEDVRAAGPGRFTARFVAPDEGYPQLACLSAVGTTPAGQVHGWTTLPLWGRADAVVHATPGASINVQIGARTYGPVRTSRSGIAQVPLEVAPGETDAWHGKKRIPLKIPASLPLHVYALSPSVRADQEELVELVFATVEKDGSPRTSARVRASASAGSVGPITAVEGRPGTWTARWRIPPGPPTTLRLDASLDGVPRSATRLELPRVAGPLKVLRVELADGTGPILAGTPTARFVARGEDAEGNAVSPEIVWSAGLCTRVEPQGRPGMAEMTCQLPTNFGGATELVVEARAAARDGAITARSSVPLRAGEATRFELTPSELRVEGDGETTATLTLTAFDAYGNPAPSRLGQLRVVPALGSASASSAAVEGEAPEAVRHVVTYRAPVVRRRTEVVLEADAGELRSSGRIELLPGARHLSLLPRVGVSSNFSDVTTPFVAVEASYDLTRGFGASLEAARHLASTVRPDGSGVTSELALTPLWIGAYYRWSAGEDLALVARASAGATHLSHAVLGDGAAANESGWAPAVQVGADAEWFLWHGAPTVSARVGWVRDPGFSTVSGALLSASLSAGYRFELW